MHFFTSITMNYLPKARVLAKSIKKFNPNAVFWLVVSDKIPKDFSLETEPFDHMLEIKDLINVPNLDSWIFKHTVVELCTAVKGAAFLKIFEKKDVDKVIYLDPDIAVFDSLEGLEKLLEQHSVVLTPHQFVPDVLPEAIIDNEICCLRHGIYNLGFVGVRNSPDGVAFVKWWHERLLEHCYDDVSNGLFTDQKWVDLAPVFFPNIYIIRDSSYNVATWNITNRRIDYKGSQFFVDGQTLKFYHFSGFDSGAYEIMLRKYGIHSEALFLLKDWYSKVLGDEGQAEYGSVSCCYMYFSNGAKITKLHRKIYRRRQDLIDAFPAPFLVSANSPNYYSWFNKEYSECNLDFDEGETLFEKAIELQKIKQSRSWKITAPLRWIRRMF